MSDSDTAYGLLLAGLELMAAVEAGDDYLLAANVSGHKADGASDGCADNGFPDAEALFVGGEGCAAALRTAGDSRRLVLHNAASGVYLCLVFWGEVERIGILLILAVVRI